MKLLWGAYKTANSFPNMRVQTRDLPMILTEGGTQQIHSRWRLNLGIWAFWSISLDYEFPVTDNFSWWNLLQNTLANVKIFELKVHIGRLRLSRGYTSQLSFLLKCLHKLKLPSDRACVVFPSGGTCIHQLFHLGIWYLQLEMHFIQSLRGPRDMLWVIPCPQILLHARGSFSSFVKSLIELMSVIYRKTPFIDWLTGRPNWNVRLH